MSYLIYNIIKEQTMTSIKDDIVGLINKAIAEEKIKHEENGDSQIENFSLKSWYDLACVGVDGLLVNIAYNLVKLKKPKSYKEFCDLCRKEIAFLKECGCDDNFVSQIPEIIWQARLDPKNKLGNSHFMRHDEYDKFVSFGQLFHKSQPLSYRILSSNILMSICMAASLLIWGIGLFSSQEGKYCFILLLPIVVFASLPYLIFEEKKYRFLFMPLSIVFSILLILILIIFFLSWWDSDWWISDYKFYSVIFYKLNLYDLRTTITLLFIPLLFSPVYYFNESKVERSNISSLFTEVKVKNICHE